MKPTARSCPRFGRVWAMMVSGWLPAATAVRRAERGVQEREGKEGWGGTAVHALGQELLRRHFAGVFVDVLRPAGVRRSEAGQVVDCVVHDHPRVLLRVMLGHLRIVELCRHLHTPPGQCAGAPSPSGSPPRCQLSPLSPPPARPPARTAQGTGSSRRGRTQARKDGRVSSVQPAGACCLVPAAVLAHSPLRT